MNTVLTGRGASSVRSAHGIPSTGNRGGKNVKIPDEYICNLCGYAFLDGEVPENFCPNCGSSMVMKEMSYDEYLDEEAFINMQILNL
jgi:DNA-directed RNA polymerase subunit RPC12/RpoP